MTENLIGRALGQYELVDIAGVGGLATVYKAYQPNLERWVAVKVLHSRDRRLLARFAREAKAVAQLRHRNILIVHEYGEDAGWPYIVMEYVEGGTLAKCLTTGEPLDWEYVVTLTIPLARALHYAHEHGLIHRDVKPSNVLMPQPDWPLLADFGLVKVPHPEESITESNVAIGTPSYIPPEQAGAGEVDFRADMYSLGVIMFEMVTGHLPFEYNNVNQIIFAHLVELAPSPRDLNPNCPPKLEEVILTAMQKLPDDRYANLQVMAAVLEDILKGSTKPSIEAVTPVEPSTTPSSTGTRPTPDSYELEAEAISRQEVKILLQDQHVTIDVPEPGEHGLIIGRKHKQAQVDIDLGPYEALDAGVSRQHARLFQQGNEWFIDDLGSMNGTYVNRKKITPGTPVPLKNGDLIRCSKLSFIFLISFKA